MKSTIKEIADELKANGELDEEKLRMLEKEQRRISRIIYSVVVLIIIGTLAKISLIGVIFAGGAIYGLIILVLENGKKEWTIMTHLFSNGIKCKAILKNISAHWGPYTKIECLINLGNEKFHDTFIASPKFLTKNNCPKVGNEIEIIYDGRNPSLRRFYNKEYADFFCIRKHRQGGIHD